MDSKSNYKSMPKFWRFLSNYALPINIGFILICIVLALLTDQPFGYVSLIWVMGSAVITNRVNNLYEKYAEITLSSGLNWSTFDDQLLNLRMLLRELLVQKLSTRQRKLFKFALEQIHNGLHVEQLDHAILTARDLIFLVESQERSEKNKLDYGNPALLEFINFIWDEVDDQVDQLRSPVRNELVRLTEIDKPIQIGLRTKLANLDALKTYIRTLSVYYRFHEHASVDQMSKFIDLMPRIYTDLEMSKFWLTELCKIYLALSAQPDKQTSLLASFAAKIDNGFALNDPVIRLMDMDDWTEEWMDETLIPDNSNLAELLRLCRRFLKVKSKTSEWNILPDTQESYSS